LHIGAKQWSQDAATKTKYWSVHNSECDMSTCLSKIVANSRPLDLQACWSVALS
jgi:hypothetical protein